MGDHPTFEGKAACYAAGRKGYAQEVYDFIASQAPAGEYPVAADMGSGTGLFAQGLLERGYAVLGVEPLAQMRERAQDRLDSMVRYRAIPQSAENTGLEMCIRDRRTDFAVPEGIPDQPAGPLAEGLLPAG